MADTSISLCMVVRNAAPHLERLLPRVGTIVQEILICDQESTDDTVKVAQKYGARVMPTTCKGYADPDRQYCYNNASCDWILAMDPDEDLDSFLLASIPEMAAEPNVDCYWFMFENRVNGVDISDVTGPDPHPRMWRKLLPDGQPNVQWPAEAHQFPLIRSPRVCYTEKGRFIHSRSLDEIEKSHAARFPQITGEREQQLEMEFMKIVRERCGNVLPGDFTASKVKNPGTDSKPVGRQP